MQYKEQVPKLPKLYKVLSNGMSCDGGNYTWNTSGVRNHLPESHRRLPLSHCSVGFHLTTDWRRWYKFGRDVYTANVPHGEVLVKLDSLRQCEDKVVANQVVLSQKNEIPLVRLLNQFYDDAVWVRANWTKLHRNRRRSKLAENAIVDSAGVRSNRLWASSVGYKPRLGSFSTMPFGDSDSDFLSTLSFITTLLVKSDDKTITEAEKQAVHDVWNLWKSGWAVKGIMGSTYVVN